MEALEEVDVGWIDVEQESILTLAEAARYLPIRRRGKPVHVNTLRRWASRGLRGQRLETVLVGGVRCTSKEALGRFIVRCTAVGRGTMAGRGSSELRVSDGATRTLREAGIADPGCGSEETVA
ncbi:MAG: DUF1580 domain-containing protein [Planctomycetes bacterium]|nr:DUF1580 domain-containing protein [Planctomycetota bacterium]